MRREIYAHFCTFLDMLGMDMKINMIERNVDIFNVFIYCRLNYVSASCLVHGISMLGKPPLRPV